MNACPTCRDTGSVGFLPRWWLLVNELEDTFLDWLLKRTCPDCNGNPKSQRHEEALSALYQRDYDRRFEERFNAQAKALDASLVAAHLNLSARLAAAESSCTRRAISITSTRQRLDSSATLFSGDDSHGDYENGHGR